jgi:DNA-binding PadR family transcriptional regulator
MNRKTYIEQVVEAWESEYKKGLLTFWILLSLYDGEKHVREIKRFIECEAVTNLEVDEKSVYRSVGRLRKMELIASRSVDSSQGGPALKVNYLTVDGLEALRRFYQNNIRQIFLSEEFKRRTKGLN